MGSQDRLCNSYNNKSYRGGGGGGGGGEGEGGGGEGGVVSLSHAAWSKGNVV
jgi:hypothetical protein